MKSLFKASYGFGILVFALIAQVSISLIEEYLIPDGDLFYKHLFQPAIPLLFLFQFVYFHLSRIKPVLEWRGFSLRVVYALELGLAVYAVIYLSAHSPDVFVDDAGFIFRYLDNFREGCFFCFNVEEGPVYGFSGIVHGLVSVIYMFLGNLEPEKAVLLSNYTGIVASIFIVFRLLWHVLKKPGVNLILTAVVCLTSSASLVIVNKGMETPLHLAITLSVVLFFFTRQYRLMWLFAALAVISKLTAVPVVAAVGLFWMVREKERLFNKTTFRTVIKMPLIWAGIPVAVWIVFAWIVFGSPLPQSGYAKAFFHLHREGFFPFFEYFLEKPFRALITLSTGAFILTHLYFLLVRREKGEWLKFLPGLAAIAVLTLYYFYNPWERMLWYYPLPEILLVIQLVISCFRVCHYMFRIAPEWPVWLLGMLALVTTWTPRQNMISWYQTAIHRMDGERAEIGDYLAASVSEGDTVAVSHGLIGSPVNAFVLDVTGLNSKLVTDYELNFDSLIRDFRPKYVVNQNNGSFIDRMNREGYTLVRSWYEITTYSALSWRMFRRCEGGQKAFTRLITEKQLQADDLDSGGSPEVRTIRGKHFRIPYEDVLEGTDSLFFGVFRVSQGYWFEALDIAGGDTLSRERFEVLPIEKESSPPRYTMAFKFGLVKDSIDRERRIELIPLDWLDIVIVDPTIKSLAN